MIVNFSNIDQNDRPILILKRADGTPIGALGYAVDVELDAHYNELSVLNFRLPAYVDGKEVPLYDELTGLKIVELKDVAQFVLNKPVESGDAINVSKQVEAYSLEHEFARKKIVLPESTYKFFSLTNPEGTLLGMIMELMPNWTVGSVASTIVNKYRTFDVSNENLYNFMIDTVQEAYNCIFEFDTLNRTVNVRDASVDAAQRQVFISRENLAKDINVEENTDELVTRLDVSGADGVDIRDVNPTGTNQIINLDYFMTEKNFTPELIAKYNAWKQLIEDNKEPFYNYAIQYSILVAQEITENAKLADLQGEYTSLENIQNVIIQGVASNIRTQADLDTANANLAAKQVEIDAKQAEIDDVVENKEEAMAAMAAIRNACAYAKYFTVAEQKAMDAYIKDDEIADSSFVASEYQTYTDGAGNNLTNKTVTITGAEVSTTATAAGSTVYTVNNGTTNVAGIVTGQVISAVFEQRTNGKIVASIYAGGGSYTGSAFPSACITISGTGSIQATATNLTCSVTNAYMFFSLNASDFEKKTVAWDLYAYGEEILRKLASPSFTFSVDSANFIALAEFEKFKNELELGQKVYIGVTKDNVLKPICTGAKIRYEDKPTLELVFSDTYTANDSSFKLADILGSGISMGRTFNTGKFTYTAFTESGASSELRQFIESSLDTAKNAIMSSTEQAVSWDGAGLRLRKWRNDSHTAYDPEQIWMSNNSITMTDDGWATAKMAIGKFHDANLGDTWGIVAPMVVGTLLAGTELVIESERMDGGTRVFRMDADGCRLYNSEFRIMRTNTGGSTTEILLDPTVGVAMGTYPLLTNQGAINTDNAKMWVDTSGTMHLTGSIISHDGIIGGWVIDENDLHNGSGQNYVALSVNPQSTYRIWAGNETPAKAEFSVQSDGTLTAKLGKVGGWFIGSDYIGNANTKAGSAVGMAASTVGTDIVFWAGNSTPSSANFQVLENGKLVSKNIEVSGGSITIKDSNNNNLFYVNQDGGYIGGWYISSSHIGNATTKGASTAGMSAATGTGIAFWAGNSSNDVSTAKFRVTAGGAVSATDMTITGGSITIKNSSNQTMFSVSTEGSLTAKSGQVGGWYIGSDYIGNANTKANSTVGLAASTTAANIVFWAGNKTASSANFYVTAGGSVSAKQLDIYGGSISIKNASNQEMFAVSSLGSLTAKDGTIGGWYISTNHIGTVAVKANSTVGMANATGDNVAFWAGNSSNNVSTASFRVTGNGKITATSGTVGGWYIGSDYIGNASTKADSTVGWYVSTTTTDIALWAGNKTPTSANFYVTVGGKLHCADLDIAGGGININAGVFKVESDGTLTAKKGTIGGWTISTANLHTGSGTTYVCLNGVGGDDQSWAMWCGATAVGSAPFRVTRTGDVYINSLKVWDGTAWQTIDFSGNFSNAVSLSAGGSWSGNTFTATVKLWGKINKSISMSATASVNSAGMTSAGDSGKAGKGMVNVNFNVNGSGNHLYTFTDVPMDGRVEYNNGWAMSAMCIKYTSGKNFVTIPDKSTPNDTTTLNITATYDAGYNDGKKDYRPGSITQDTTNKRVTILNDAGDSLGTYSASDIWQAGYNSGNSAGYDSGWNACRTATQNSGERLSYYTGTETTVPIVGVGNVKVLSPYQSHQATLYTIPARR